MREKYNLATCYLQLQQIELAIPILLAVCSEAPDMLPAAFNLALAFQKLKKYADALHWFKRSLPLGEHNSSVYIELARCYFQLKDYSHSLDCYLKLQAADIDASIAVEIVESCYLAGDTQRALALLAEYLDRFQDNSANLQLLLSDIYTNTGKLEAARTALRPLLDDRSGEYFPAAANLAVRLAWENSEQLLHDMQSRLAENRTSIDDEIKLRFGLGQLYDGLADYKCAAEHYELANNLNASRVAYDSKRLEALVSQLTEVFSATGLIAAKQQSDIRPVFVLGMPRSGTSLIGQILNAHNDIHNAGELAYFHQLSAGITDLLQLSAEYPNCLLALTDKQWEKLGCPMYLC